jgi:hypothetical protein
VVGAVVLVVWKRVRSIRWGWALVGQGEAD